MSRAGFGGVPGRLLPVQRSWKARPERRSRSSDRSSAMEKVLRVDAVGARHGESVEQAASAATGAPASREAHAREATSWSFLFHLARVPYGILVLVGLGLL